MNALPGRAHHGRRDREGALRVLSRALLFLAWIGVLWGTLLFLSFLATSISEGPGVAVARLDPRGQSGLFAWINAACAFLAPLAWLSLAGFVAPRRRA